MTEKTHKLARPPIVEAVLDIDCDLPPNLEIESLEQPAHERFRGEYPGLETRFLLKHKVQIREKEPSETATQHGVQGYLFRSEDGKQLVQVRTQGFSFNRLAPYSSLDDYVPEIERTWRVFLELTSPVQIRNIRLRYINRLLLPSVDGRIELDDYLKIGPRLPDEERLTFRGFLNQHVALEKETGNEVKIILTSQNPEQDGFPVILDITATNDKMLDSIEWSQIESTIQSLRDLKNQVFYNTLTDKCLQLFQ